MGKGKFNAVAVGFVAVIVVLVVAVMVSNLRRTTYITLPELTDSSPAASGDSETEDAVIRIEVTPETVQAAIATLSRPAEYRRQMTVERFWSGGSGTTAVSVLEGGGWIRIDTTEVGGRVRHTISNGETVYVWYDAERNFYTGPAGDISADQEQGILTYEDILALDTETIVLADYRTWNDQECIYLETEEGGRLCRYWVSLSSGLLVGAETLQDGEAVSRVTAQPILDTRPTPADLTLPDGTVLWKE